MLPHMLPKPSFVCTNKYMARPGLEAQLFGPSPFKDAPSSASAVSGRYIQVREKMPAQLSATVANAAQEELISEEWSSLVDEHMMESPRAAHMRLREIRHTLKMQQASQKEAFREMQAKLERYERNEPSPRLQKSRVEEAQPQPTKPPPFSQKQQREILQEFQRQQEEELQQQKDLQEAKIQQERQTRRLSRRKSQEGARAATPTAPPRRKTSSLGQMFAHVRAKMSLFFGRGRDAVTAYEGENAAFVDAQVEGLLRHVEETLASTRHEPVAVRRKVFRELQRKLHPDKNSHCSEAAKLAFQQLMDQQTGYLQQRH